MKKILILQGVGMALLLPGAACAAAQLLYGRAPAALWCAGAVCLAAAFAVFAAALIFLRQQQRIMRFLVRQTAADREAGDERAGEILRRRMELTVLQNQINPHFLYNTLDGIRGEALANGQTEIANMTERLSRFFRYCISGQEAMVKLSEEIRHVEDYFFIQKYRFGDRIDLELEVEDERLYDCYLPKVTLQPIVENSIAHGIEEIRRKGIVRIRAGASEQMLCIEIEDNGRGMEQEELERLNRRLKDRQVEVSVSGDSKHTGIAIKNVNSRIKLSFGEQYGLHYRSMKDCGTQVEILLPLIDDFSRESFEKQLREIE